ncbi:MAG TPA: cation:proton antiporter [Burkholderiaceae bacterium]|nr:cation:proton antiporter [Burkholderiaceae bacterium]
MPNENFSFLPSWPLDIGPLLWVAVLLLAAIMAGEATRRWLRVSRIVGYVATGVLLGPPIAGLIDQQTVAQLRIFADVAIGLLLFELGQRVDIDWLRRNPALLATSVAEALLTFVAVAGVMLVFGARPAVAAACGIIAIVTSPAVVMTVVKDLRAQGQVTERTMLLSALNTAYASVGMALIFGWLSVDAERGIAGVIAHPLYLVAGSLLLAALLARGSLEALRLLGRRAVFQFALLVAIVLLTVAAATTLHLSVPLALLLLGLFVRVFDRARHFVALRFGETAMLLVVVLFALAGASLQLGGIGALPVAILIIVARFLAKTLPLAFFAPPSALTVRKAVLIGIALTPSSALALLMLTDLAHVFPNLEPHVMGAMFWALGILAFAGPIGAEYALRQAKEAHEES